MNRVWMTLAAAVVTSAAGTAMAQEGGGRPAYRPAEVVRIRPMPPEWVWVEPVYQVVVERVWVGEQIQRLPSQYWVSPVYGWRTVIYCDEFGQRIQTREWGEISAGRYETAYREVVVAGHWENRERRVLVRDGYWRRVGTVIVEPPVVIDPPVRQVNPGTVGVEGYGKEWEQDKGKFSPLYEWPK